MNDKARLDEVKKEIQFLYKQVDEHQEQLERCKSTIETERQAVANATEAGMDEDANILSEAVKNLEIAEEKLVQDISNAKTKLENLKIEYRALIVTVGELWLSELENNSDRSQEDSSVNQADSTNSNQQNKQLSQSINPVGTITGMPAYDSVLALEKTLAIFNAYLETADRNYEEANHELEILHNEAEVARLTKKYTVGEYSSTVNEELKALKEKINS